REMRARFLRPVSALIRLDLPTLERPAKAISTPRIDGSDAGGTAGVTKRHSRVKRRRPASISARVKWSAVIGASIFPASCPRIAVQRDGVLSHAYVAGHPRLSSRALKTWIGCPQPYCDAFFFTNNALMLSNNSILAPCLRMMTLCCSTESELFHAQ